MSGAKSSRSALTADQVAVALIAGASLYGVAPERVFEHQGAGLRTGAARRCAGAALVLAGFAQGDVARMLGLKGGYPFAPSNLKLCGILESQVRAVLQAIGGGTAIATFAPRGETSATPPRAPVDAFKGHAGPITHAVPPSAPAPRRSIAPAEIPVSPVGERILGLLAQGAHTSVALATRLGAKELHVSQALSVLAHDGRIRGGALDDRGVRARLWRLAEPADHG